MNVVCGHSCELRDPRPYIITITIIVLRLQQHVEVIDAAWPNTSHRVPITIVRMNIMIDQVLLEVVRPEAPVLLQIESQVCSDDLAPTVAHVARSVELSHACIDNWHSSLPRFPSVDQLSISAPLREAIVADWPYALQLEHLGLMRFAVEAKEVTHSQLKV